MSNMNEVTRWSDEFHTAHLIIAITVAVLFAIVVVAGIVELIGSRRRRRK